MLSLHTFRVPSKLGPLERNPACSLERILTALCHQIVLEKQDLSPSHIQTWVFNSQHIYLKMVPSIYFMDITYKPSFRKRKLLHKPVSLAYLLFPLLELKAYATHVDFHGCRKFNLASFLWDKNLTELSLRSLPSPQHTLFFIS